MTQPIKTEPRVVCSSLLTMKRGYKNGISISIHTTTLDCYLPKQRKNVNTQKWKKFLHYPL